MSLLTTLAVLLVASSTATIISSDVEHNILGPVFHYVAERSNLYHLSPSLRNHLHYGKRSSKRRDVNPGPGAGISARIQAQFIYPTVVLDHSHHIERAVCDPSVTHMNITINTAEAYLHATEEWSNLEKLLFLSADVSCHPKHPGQLGYFLASHLEFDPPTSQVYAYGHRISPADVLDHAQLDWGQHSDQEPLGMDRREAAPQAKSTSTTMTTSGSKTSSDPFKVPPTSTSTKTTSTGGGSGGGTNSPGTSTGTTTLGTSTKGSSTTAATTCGNPPLATISGLPAAPCGNGFDAALDAGHGYIATDSSDASQISKQVAAFAPNTGLSFDQFVQYTNGTYKRDLLESRSAWSWFSDNIIKPVAKAVTSVAKSVVNFVETAEKVVSAIVKAVTGEYTGDISIPLPVNIGPPEFMLKESPWGKAFQIFSIDEDGASSFLDHDKKALLELAGTDQILEAITPDGVERIPNPSITLFCVQCGIKGHFTSTGSATFGLTKGITAMSIGLTGNLKVEVNLGIDAYATMTIPLGSIRVLTAGVPGLSIPDIITVGPMVTLDIDSNVKVQALGQILSGVALSWPNINAKLDILNPGASYGSGFGPAVSNNFQATGSLNVFASMGIPVGIGLGVDVLNGKYKYSLALVDRPAIGANATYTLSAQGQSSSSNGQNSGSSTVVSGQGGCQGISWNVGFYNQLYFAVGERKWAIGDWKGPTLAQGCLGGTPNTNCSNQGMQLAHFSNPAGEDNDYKYGSFDPKAYYTAKPDYFTVVNNAASFYIDGKSDWTPQGSTSSTSSSFFTLVYRGYLFAKMRGQYTFTASKPDDIVFVWVGADAYDGYTRDNADILYTYRMEGDHASGNTFQKTLLQGQYYPIRIMMGQEHGPASFNFQITAPDGTVILGPNSQANPYLVQQSCDGTTAKPFRSWGMEPDTSGN